jgi:hypothetical protein
MQDGNFRPKINENSDEYMNVAAAESIHKATDMQVQTRSLYFHPIPIHGRLVYY